MRIVPPKTFSRAPIPPNFHVREEAVSFIDGAAEVPAETFAGAHPSGWRRLLPFTRSWVTTGLRQDLRYAVD